MRDASMDPGVSTAEATVLVIDDAAQVRGGRSGLLRSAGWSVLAFGAAQEFLDQRPARSAGCILLDVVLPGMSGPELRQRLKDLDLRIPVIYLSGKGKAPVSGQVLAKIGVRSVARLVRRREESGSER